MDFLIEVQGSPTKVIHSFAKLPSYPKAGVVVKDGECTGGVDVDSTCAVP